MKHCATRCRHRAERGRALWRAAAAGLLLASLGCVTRATYNEDVGRLEEENKRLTTRVESLARTNSSLDEERVRLADELEDLREARETLTRDVAKLEKSRDLLTEHLRERDAQVTELSKTSSTYEALVQDLESEVTSGRIQIEQLRDGIRLNLPQSILFPSGSAQLQDSGKAVLTKVADRLKSVDHRIEVQGHTDNVAIAGRLARRFGSNWELAGARASQVVRLLQDQGVDPGRMVAISHGEFSPIADNDSPEGRARNRRIEIRLRPLQRPGVPAARAQGA